MLEKLDAAIAREKDRLHDCTTPMSARVTNAGYRYAAGTFLALIQRDQFRKYCRHACSLCAILTRQGQDRPKIQSISDSCIYQLDPPPVTKAGPGLLKNMLKHGLRFLHLS